MATYSFATITTAQALALAASDTLQFDQGSGADTIARFVTGTNGSPDTISLQLAARTVAFSTALANATISYADGSHLFVGTAAGDTVTYGATNDGLYGGLGNDTLNAGDGTNRAQGNQGDDRLIGGAGADQLYGGQDNDTISVGTSAAGGAGNFVNGNKGSDTISGSTKDNDILLGGQGDDLIGVTGLGPPTSIDGANVNIYLQPIGFSGGGADTLNGNLGNDTLFGGQGDDRILGEDGDDYLADAGGHSTIDGGDGNDLIAVRGDITVFGGAGNDLVGFGSSTGTIDLGDGDDMAGDLTDGNVADHLVIHGGAGNDNITSTDGSDTMFGDDGADTIDGQGEPDQLWGGAGVDYFQYYGEENGTGAGTLDSIMDWATEDRLEFLDFFDDNLAAGTAANYVEATKADYAAALSYANGQIGAGTINYVAVQVGSDVFVFADSLNDNGSADTATKLVGRSLADIGFSNFVGT